MRNRIWISLASGAIFAMTATAVAHHSVDGQFDRSDRVELSGVISKVDWINPHIYLHLDVKDGTGATTTWRLETVPPSYLYKVEVTPDMLSGGGQPVRVEAARAWDKNENLGYIIRIHYPEGHHYQLSSDD